jgi:hypothetical protein
VSLDNETILNKINSLTINQWNYKLEDQSVRHIGPFAEDFYDMFGVGNDSKHIASLDTAGIALVGIQGLSKKFADLEQKNATTSGNTVVTITTNESVATIAAQITTIDTKIDTLVTNIDLLSSTIESLKNSYLNDASLSAFVTNNTTAVLGVSTTAATLADELANLPKATFTGDLQVAGRSILNDVGITGSLTTGVISVDGLEGTINTLGGDLKLQTLGLNGIDILDGKVTIDTQGNIATTGIITSKKIQIDTQDTSSPSLGSGTITAGETTITIPTTTVTTTSKIFVTATAKTGEQSLIVTHKNPGVGFDITIETPHTTDITFDWFIIDEKQ